MFTLKSQIFIWLIFGAVLICLSSCSTALGESVPTPVNTPTTRDNATAAQDLTVSELQGDLSKYLVNGNKETNVAKAQAQLFAEGLRFYVIVVTPQSTGLEAEIYQDLVKRNIRATTGPDEGFDTTSLDCHPNCVFIYQQAVNALTVESWKNVLRHEQRHMVQAANNPNLARDFRDPNGMFTTYGAFSEGCADDGLYVGEEIYHASERMPILRKTLGEENKATLEKACTGFKDAYDQIVQIYEAETGVASFEKLFPPYK